MDFAAATFADDGEGLALLDIDRHARHGMDQRRCAEELAGGDENPCATRGWTGWRSCSGPFQGHGRLGLQRRVETRDLMPAPRSFSGGTAAQTSAANGQRVEKRQPDGIAGGLRTVPGTVTSRVLRAPSDGIEDIEANGVGDAADR